VKGGGRGDRTWCHGPSGRKGFSNKSQFCSCFHDRRCSPHRRPVREDGSGSVSAYLVAQVSAVDRLPTDPKFCDAESAGRLRTPLQTSTSTGAQRRGGASWTDYERHTHQVYRVSASRWCKCRTLTAIGVDGVRTVERERVRRTVDASRTLVERGFGGGGSCGWWRMTSKVLG
jgi:hypothetical protein